MGNLWKIAVVALLALPMGAYVVGSLVGSQAPLPEQRAPLVIVDDQSNGLRDRSDSTPRREDDRRDDGPDEERGADDGPTVVRPVPDNLDNDTGDRDDDDADDQDDESDDDDDDDEDEDDRDDRDD